MWHLANQEEKEEEGDEEGVKRATLCFAMWQWDEIQAPITGLFERERLPRDKNSHSVSNCAGNQHPSTATSPPPVRTLTHALTAEREWKQFIFLEEYEGKLNLPTPYFSCSVGIHMFTVGKFKWVVGIAAKSKVWAPCNAFYWRAFLRSVVGVIV